MERVGYLEIMEKKFREAHDASASITADMGDKVEALHMKVFPEHEEFMGALRRVYSRRHRPRE